MKIVKILIALTLILFVFSNSVSASKLETLTPIENNKGNSDKVERGSIVKDGVKYNFVIPVGKTQEEQEIFYDISMDTALKLEQSSVQEDGLISLLVPVDPDPSGVILRTSNNTFWVNTYLTAKNTFLSVVDGLVTAVGFSYANTAVQKAAVTTIASMGATSVSETSGVDYTTTKLMKFYHSGLNRYVLQEYISSYSDANKTQLTGVDLGPMLLETNGIIRDIKW